MNITPKTNGEVKAQDTEKGNVRYEIVVTGGIQRTYKVGTRIESRNRRTKKIDVTKNGSWTITTEETW